MGKLCLLLQMSAAFRYLARADILMGACAFLGRAQQRLGACPRTHLHWATTCNRWMGIYRTGLVLPWQDAGSSLSSRMFITCSLQQRVRQSSVGGIKLTYGKLLQIFQMLTAQVLPGGESSSIPALADLLVPAFILLLLLLLLLLLFWLGGYLTSIRNQTAITMLICK